MKESYIIGFFYVATSASGYNHTPDPRLDHVEVLLLASPQLVGI